MELQKNWFNSILIAHILNKYVLSGIAVDWYVMQVYSFLGYITRLTFAHPLQCFAFYCLPEKEHFRAEFTIIFESMQNCCIDEANWFLVTTAQSLLSFALPLLPPPTPVPPPFVLLLIWKWHLRCLAFLADSFLVLLHLSLIETYLWNFLSTLWYFEIDLWCKSDIYVSSLLKRFQISWRRWMWFTDRLWACIYSVKIHKIRDTEHSHLFFFISKKKTSNVSKQSDYKLRKIHSNWQAFGKFKILLSLTARVLFCFECFSFRSARQRIAERKNGNRVY